MPAHSLERFSQVRPPRALGFFLTTSFALALAGLLAYPGPVKAQKPATATVRDVNRKMVKLFGAGGFKGLPSYGTGILVSPNGYILTCNNHILATTDLRVHLWDGRQFHGKVVAKEPELDVALVKLEEPVDGLPHFDVEKEASRPIAAAGTWVLAFSNQFQIAVRDEPMSVQHGVVSTYTDLRGRRGVFEAPFGGKVYFLDVVACNPGAAGGIITTTRGELLGILGRELKNQLSDTWINYAIPIQAETEIVRDDNKTVKVNMGSFVRDGMTGKYISGKKKETARKGGGYHGVVLVPNVVPSTPPYIEGIEANSPAAKAGLRQDDLIVYIDGELVPSIREFRRLIDGYGPGDAVRLDVQRGSSLETVTLTLEKLQQQNN